MGQYTCTPVAPHNWALEGETAAGRNEQLSETKNAGSGVGGEEDGRKARQWTVKQNKENG